MESKTTSLYFSVKGLKEAKNNLTQAKKLDEEMQRVAEALESQYADAESVMYSC